MAEQSQAYRKKQAYLVLLVFVCIGVAIWGHSAPVAVGAILAACGLCFYASTLEPEKKPDEHQLSSAPGGHSYSCFKPFKT
jgi:hypothetical protein